ncbi:hypothetical protein B0T19DRAFT_187493 [Cercophora scortea]|uniref:Uncharacterized protein n=1 Tax=Cercophora scortea TaxID=314031 RepID=A0AAE0INK1_9PEZI|nr:hypothetical protein B0T19DRAFT_187493 [Cercophora scortea]
MMRSSPWSSAVLLLTLTARRAFALAYPDVAASTLSKPFLAERNYEDVVCKPVTGGSESSVPPCLNIEVIEQICNPNGTHPLALKAHQECMCGGTYFSEWPFCLQCLYIHGLRSERDVAFYKSVLATASSAFCDVPTPTAKFANVFSSAQESVPSPTTGATVTSDQAPSQSAVSLYFTATGSRGPGQITGDATAATASTLETASNIPGPSSVSQTLSSSAPITTDTSTTGSVSSTTATRSSTSASSTSTSGGAVISGGPMVVMAVSMMAIIGASML